MADSDEVTTITDKDEAKWAMDQYQLVEDYLRNQSCDHAGISLEPRWYLFPFLALWAVRSKVNPDAVGWWAISGDVPSDYITATPDLRSLTDVLAAFGTQWLHASESMARGEYCGIGKPEEVSELAPLLQARAKMLHELVEELRDDGER